MSLGSISNSFISPTLQNSLSLIQLNFDFTLQKVTPLIEYKAVGQALSEKRRSNAEDGAAHRTARKLGWLFENIIPDSPNLLKAYGQRVCDILQRPGINPVGTAADGPFCDYVGADCTSLWAAATSGNPALGVHLLACMLARAWDSQTASAIWVELVKSRQAEILERNDLVNETSIIAARQDFSRGELTDWDTSARAWLAQADKGLAVQRDQYLLIVKNVSLLTGSNRSPYPNVIRAWTHAMEVLERHLEGISQQISDGAVLYAISAWHLYPDLAHFGRGAKNVTFSDPLFVKPATMTLGLNEVAAPDDNRGVHWSLALSHLRFYGDPVQVESVQDLNKASISQFQVIVLGAVLESWQVPLRDRLEAIRWIHSLWIYLEETTPLAKADLSRSRHTSWLNGLAEAANYVLTAEGEFLEQCEAYLSHGELWATNFLQKGNVESQYIQPYFGLCNPMVMAALQEPFDVDAGIVYLRQLAHHMGLKDNEAIICYSEMRGSKGYYEYCTAIAHSDPLYGSCHARWIKISSNLKVSRNQNCQHRCHMIEGGGSDADEIDLERRMEMVQAQGEQCFRLSGKSLHERRVKVPRGHGPEKAHNYLLWDRPAPLFSSSQNRNHSRSSVGTTEGPCACLKPLEDKDTLLDMDDYERHQSDVLFIKYRGTYDERDTLDLYIRTNLHEPLKAVYDEKTSDAVRTCSSPSLGVQWLQGSSVQPVRMWDYIENFASATPWPQSEIIMREHLSPPRGLDWTFSHGRATQLIISTFMPSPRRDWFCSLELLGVVAEIYKTLPGATVCLTVVEYPLLEAHWAAISVPRSSDTHDPRGAGQLLDKMGRKETFACIAMMQTGDSNIEPGDLEEVIAISAANSIFVAASLLSDPHSVVASRDIRYIVGNVGYAGLSLMVGPPGELRIRRPVNEVRMLPRRACQGLEREDNFSGSSLHLSFTGQRFPLVTTCDDNIDQGVFYLQSVVSLWDEGRHVADLNMLNIERSDITRVKLECHCAVPKEQPVDDADVRYLDSWQDILKPPRRRGIIRAHKNWSARLAAVTLLLQQGKGHTMAILAPETLCWRCLENFFREPIPHFPEILVD